MPDSHKKVKSQSEEDFKSWNLKTPFENQNPNNLFWVVYKRETSELPERMMTSMNDMSNPHSSSTAAKKSWVSLDKVKFHF